MEIRSRSSSQINYSGGGGGGGNHTHRSSPVSSCCGSSQGRSSPDIDFYDGEPLLGPPPMPLSPGQLHSFRIKHAIQ